MSEYPGYDVARTASGELQRKAPSTEDAYTYCFKLAKSHSRISEINEQLSAEKQKEKQKKMSDPLQKKFSCVVCEFACVGVKRWNGHINSPKHSKSVKEAKKAGKLPAALKPAPTSDNEKKKKKKKKKTEKKANVEGKAEEEEVFPGLDTFDVGVVSFEDEKKAKKSYFSQHAKQKKKNPDGKSGGGKGGNKNDKFDKPIKSSNNKRKRSNSLNAQNSPKGPKAQKF